MHYFLSLTSFQYFEIKPPIPYMGLHPPHPLLQFTPFKFENLINLALKHSNLASYGILVLNKIKYPIASGGLRRPPASEIQY